MLPIAYTISPYLIRYLNSIETTRRLIVLLPLAPKTELGLHFQTAIKRVYYGLAMINQPLKTETIKTILSNQIVFAAQKDPQRYDKMQNAVIQYKQAIDFIKRDWLFNPESVTVKTLLKLYAFTTDKKMNAPEKRLQEILTYLQSTTDSPFLQSAIAKLQFRSILPEHEENELFSTLCAYLFLYKSGMDARGFILLEKPWNDEKRIFLGQYQTTLNKQNITGWLEYYVKSVAIQLEETYLELAKPPALAETNKIGKLNERQKTIMTLLEDPQAVITNRTVQKIFHISQITASRDLAKLTMLGLLFTHGKGRSVRYTRI